MGKQHQKSPFPFNLLMIWIRAYDAQGERCSACQNTVASTLSCYYDVPVTPDRAAIDAAWQACIAAQMRGTYTNYHTLYYCMDCTYCFVEATVSEEVATLSMLLFTVAGHRLSLAVGCALQDIHDHGNNFVAHFYGNSIEELTRQLQGKNVVHLSLKGA